MRVSITTIGGKCYFNQPGEEPQYLGESWLRGIDLVRRFFADSLIVPGSVTVVAYTTYFDLPTVGAVDESAAMFQMMN